MMNKPEEDVTMEDIEIGSQGQLGGMRSCRYRIFTSNDVPMAFPSGYAGYAGYANGGIARFSRKEEHLLQKIWMTFHVRMVI